MEINSDNLRFILGVKLKQFRREKGLSLKELARETGLSVSYLSEIEKGKKYPKPEKILQLARVLSVSFDDLVSLRLQKKMDSLATLLKSPVIQEFPFRMFGISPQNLMALLTGNTEKAGALLRTFLEIGQSYDMRVEHLLFTALRSYRQMHGNYFPEIEEAVLTFLKENNLSPHPPLQKAPLVHILKRRYGYVVDEEQLDSYPPLRGLRWIWLDKTPPRLLLNKHLTPGQKAFILAREIGYRELRLTDRVKTSSLKRVQSFEQLLNHFKASYFAGALVMNRDLLCQDLAELFREKRWPAGRFLALIQRYGVTPETFAYRLGELLPRFFGISDFLFFRFHSRRDSGIYSLTNLFNMSKFFLPAGMVTREHYCRRWLPVQLLRKLEEKQRNGHDGSTIIAAQRSRFLDLEVELFTITLARASRIQQKVNLSGTVSFVITKHFKQTVAFWDDPGIPVTDVNETCERCGLGENRCADRAAPPEIYAEEQAYRQQEEALQQLMRDVQRK